MFIVLVQYDIMQWHYSMHADSDDYIYLNLISRTGFELNIIAIEVNFINIGLCHMQQLSQP